MCVLACVCIDEKMRRKLPVLIPALVLTHMCSLLLVFLSHFSHTFKVRAAAGICGAEDEGAGGAGGGVPAASGEWGELG